MPPPSSADQRESGTAICLPRNQPAQRPHVHFAGAPKRDRRALACGHRRRALAPGNQAPAHRSLPGRETAPAELAGASLRHRSGFLSDGESGRSCGVPEELLLRAVAAHWRTAAATHHRGDLALELARATRYRAFSWSAVEGILAAQARPRSGWESLQAEAQDQLDEILRQSPVSTRSTAEYQALLEETVNHDETDEDDDPSA